MRLWKLKLPPGKRCGESLKIFKDSGWVSISGESATRLRKLETYAPSALPLHRISGRFGRFYLMLLYFLYSILGILV